MNKDNIVYLAIVVVSVIFVFGISWVCGEFGEAKFKESRAESEKSNENQEDDLEDEVNELELNSVVQEPFQVDDYPRKEFLPGLPYERSGTFSRYVRQLG